MCTGTLTPSRYTPDEAEHDEIDSHKCHCPYLLSFPLNQSCTGWTPLSATQIYCSSDAFQFTIDMGPQKPQSFPLQQGRQCAGETHAAEEGLQSQKFSDASKLDGISSKLIFNPKTHSQWTDWFILVQIKCVFSILQRHG